MKVTSITYSLMSTDQLTGSCQTAAITVELDEGESPAAAMDRAKSFIQTQLSWNREDSTTAEHRQQMNEIVNNPDYHRPIDVRSAQTWLANNPVPQHKTDF